MLHLGIWLLGILVLLVLGYIHNIKAGSTLLQQVMCVSHSKKDAGLGPVSVRACLRRVSILMYEQVQAPKPGSLVLVPIGLDDCVNGCLSFYVAL